MTKILDYTSMGRDKLIEEHKVMLENLTKTQERCTQLLELLRESKKLLEEESILKSKLENLEKYQKGFEIYVDTVVIQLKEMSNSGCLPTEENIRLVRLIEILSKKSFL